jgi:hypothetical protein
VTKYSVNKIVNVCYNFKGYMADMTEFDKHVLD